jgi:hypothetical protein
VLPTSSTTLNDPSGAHAAAKGLDPELISLPAPPKRERTATVLLMIVTTVAASWMVFALLGEARYALTPGKPIELADLTALHPGSDLENRYVRTSALLGTKGAIKYGRTAEGDSFRLTPVAGNSTLWVETRVPEGFEGPRFVPPTTFAGRLVPFSRAGVRHIGLTELVRERTDTNVPERAWLLIDGSAPRASRWALALVVLFTGFALWNIVAAVRVLARVRDHDSTADGTHANE